ncbi:hypothetical protein ABFS83_12G120800 [Erythranthe nasuta]
MEGGNCLKSSSIVILLLVFILLVINAPSGSLAVASSSAEERITRRTPLCPNDFNCRLNRKPGVERVGLPPPPPPLFRIPKHWRFVLSSPPPPPPLLYA